MIRADAGRDVDIFRGVFLVLPRSLIDTARVYVPSSRVACFEEQPEPGARWCGELQVTHADCVSGAI